MLLLPPLPRLLSLQRSRSPGLVRKTVLAHLWYSKEYNSSSTQAWGVKPYKALRAVGKVPNLTALICGFLEEENYKPEQGREGHPGAYLVIKKEKQTEMNKK